ncbi:hypothetical protein BDR04DRAFT_1092009 [Suillus decipiens]|nr:hypothetical protein BDR04DRAFT_1092009 [Suillus decipiens]
MSSANSEAHHKGRPTSCKVVSTSDALAIQKNLSSSSPRSAAYDDNLVPCPAVLRCSSSCQSAPISHSSPDLLTCTAIVCIRMPKICARCGVGSRCKVLRTPSTAHLGDWRSDPTYRVENVGRHCSRRSLLGNHALKDCTRTLATSLLRALAPTYVFLVMNTPM